MKVCPQCGCRDNPLWKPLFWKFYWEYMPLEDFKREYGYVEQLHERKFCADGDFYYDFEDAHYYYRVSGKTRRMVHRFPKGFESMGNRRLFEKTPSEKGFEKLEGAEA